MRARHAAERKIASSPELKICSKCGQEKPRSEFFTRPESPDGLRADCKKCCSDRTRRWLDRDSNKERKRAINKAYHDQNAEHTNAEFRRRYAEDEVFRASIRANNKKSREKNPEKYREHSRQRRRDKPETVRAARRQHYRDNKGRYVAQARAREDRIKRATPPWADLKAIEEFYVQAERLTRETGIEHHVDHFYPLRGKTMCGLHVEANLRVVPAGVNLAKGNAIQAEAGEPLCCAWPTVMQLPA